MTHSASSLVYSNDNFSALTDCLTEWFGPAGHSWSLVKLGSSGHARIELPAGDLYIEPGQTVWIKRTSVLVVVK